MEIRIGEQPIDRHLSNRVIFTSHTLSKEKKKDKKKSALRSIIQRIGFKMWRKP